VIVLGVIPARYGSTRYPAKPLVPIAGVPLLERVIRGALQSKKISQVLVATDHEAIAELARKAGVEAVMTDPALPSGSDRVWAAVKDRKFDVVLNIQGDEPLITGGLLDSLIRPFEEDPALEMGTLGRPLKRDELNNLSVAKIILNRRSEALYFSRAPIPFTRKKTGDLILPGVLKHIGMYAYRGKFLEKFCAQKPVEIELAEGLEQLRALWLGARIKVVETEHDSWGVDTPEDVKKVEDKLRGMK